MHELVFKVEGGACFRMYGFKARTSGAESAERYRMAVVGASGEFSWFLGGKFASEKPGPSSARTPGDRERNQTGEDFNMPFVPFDFACVLEARDSPVWPGFQYGATSNMLYGHELALK